MRDAIEPAMVDPRREDDMIRRGVSIEPDDVRFGSLADIMLTSSLLGSTSLEGLDRDPKAAQYFPYQESIGFALCSRSITTHFRRTAGKH